MRTTLAVSRMAKMMPAMAAARGDRRGRREIEPGGGMGVSFTLAPHLPRSPAKDRANRAYAYTPMILVGGRLERSFKVT